MLNQVELSAFYGGIICDPLGGLPRGGNYGVGVRDAARRRSRPPEQRHVRVQLKPVRTITLVEFALHEANTLFKPFTPRGLPVRLRGVNDADSVTTFGEAVRILINDLEAADRDAARTR